MAKLTIKCEFKKDGSKTIKGYAASLSKSGVEGIGFNDKTELEIEYQKDKIIISKK